MKILGFILSIIFTSCISNVNKDRFVTKVSKENKIIVNIPFNNAGGYYSIDSLYKVLSVYFFYSNAMVLNIAFDSNHYNKSTIKSDIEKQINKFTNARKPYDYFDYGGFEIKNSNIKVQFMHYIPQGAWGTASLTGFIANDTTIVISKYSLPAKKYVDSTVKIYHYLECNKPDFSRGNKWKNKKWYWRD